MSHFRNKLQQTSSPVWCSSSVLSTLNMSSAGFLHPFTLMQAKLTWLAHSHSATASWVELTLLALIYIQKGLRWLVLNFVHRVPNRTPCTTWLQLVLHTTPPKHPAQPGPWLQVNKHRAELIKPLTTSSSSSSGLLANLLDMQTGL